MTTVWFSRTPLTASITVTFSMAHAAGSFSAVKDPGSTAKATHARTKEMAAWPGVRFFMRRVGVTEEVVEGVPWEDNRALPKIASDGEQRQHPARPTPTRERPALAPSAAPIPLADGRFYGAEPLTQTDVRP